MIEITDSYLHACCIGLHDNWIETHRELREVSDPSWRKALIEDLKDTYSKAKTLLEYGYDLHPIDAAALKHITARSIKQHIAVLSTK